MLCAGQAKRLLTELVMTPPKTPPPAGLTPKKAGPGEPRFFPANDRLRALRVETGACVLSCAPCRWFLQFAGATAL